MSSGFAATDFTGNRVLRTETGLLITGPRPVEVSDRAPNGWRARPIRISFEPLQLKPVRYEAPPSKERSSCSWGT